MLVYGESIGDDDCKLNIDNQTTNFIVAFFGFFPHNIHERFEKFLDSLEIDEIADHGETDISNFSLNGRYGVEAYNAVDRRTFDVTIVLPKTFKSEMQARYWLNEKIKKSYYMSIADFCDIEVLDGDKLIELINERVLFQKKRNLLKDNLKKEIESLREKMIQKYCEDENDINFINSKLDRLK